MYQGEEPFKRIPTFLLRISTCDNVFPRPTYHETGFPLKTERAIHGTFEGHNESLREECLS